MLRKIKIRWCSKAFQVRLFDLHPTGAMTKDERLDALMSRRFARMW